MNPGEGQHGIPGGGGAGDQDPLGWGRRGGEAGKGAGPVTSASPNGRKEARGRGHAAWRAGPLRSDPGVRSAAATGRNPSGTRSPARPIGARRVARSPPPGPSPSPGPPWPGPQPSRRRDRRRPCGCCRRCCCCSSAKPVRVRRRLPPRETQPLRTFRVGAARAPTPAPPPVRRDPVSPAPFLAGPTDSDPPHPILSERLCPLPLCVPLTLNILLNPNSPSYAGL